MRAMSDPISKHVNHAISPVGPIGRVLMELPAGSGAPEAKFRRYSSFVYHHPRRSRRGSSRVAAVRTSRAQSWQWIHRPSDLRLGPACLGVWQSRPDTDARYSCRTLGSEICSPPSSGSAKIAGLDRLNSTIASRLA